MAAGAPEVKQMRYWSVREVPLHGWSGCRGRPEAARPADPYAIDPLRKSVDLDQKERRGALLTSAKSLREVTRPELVPAGG
jgi:hypothetical protein